MGYDEEPALPTNVHRQGRLCYGSILSLTKDFQTVEFLSQDEALTLATLLSPFFKETVELRTVTPADLADVFMQSLYLGIEGLTDINGIVGVVSAPG